MRGEILFSRAWLLCEGPSDFDILHGFARAMGSTLDAQGVSVIDYQNSGNPGAFVALARGLGFPWFMLCDNDSGGKEHVEQVRKRGVTATEMDERVAMLPGGDMEAYLAERFPAELGAIATKMGAKLPELANSAYTSQLAQFLRGNKTEYAARFAKVASKWEPAKVPEPISSTLKRCLEAAGG
jgi:putative ATP-dependent endonuclease of OLD family